jgi:GGDEF domain-containing protein
VSLSVGASLYTTPALTLEKLMAAADAALYDAKRAGRDRLIVSPAHITATSP